MTPPSNTEASGNLESGSWFRSYMQAYQKSLFEKDVAEDLAAFRDLIIQTKENGGKLLFAGNGASAAISSHAAVDFTKQCEIRSICFNEADLITCFGNDYGYEAWIKEALKAYADPGDCVVLISSSGSSPNVVAAGRHCLEQNISLVTFTGFQPDNPLRQLGQTNLWLDSDSYNIVECTHMIWIMAVCDNIAAINSSV
jgi:D-sedoheptulose 7-phosphate isomerase